MCIVEWFAGEKMVLFRVEYLACEKRTVFFLLRNSVIYVMFLFYSP